MGKNKDCLLKLQKPMYRWWLFVAIWPILIKLLDLLITKIRKDTRLYNLQKSSNTMHLWHSSIPRMANSKQRFLNTTLSGPMVNRSAHITWSSQDDHLGHSYRSFDNPPRSIFCSFSSNVSKASHFSSIWLQNIDEYSNGQHDLFIFKITRQQFESHRDMQL